MKALAMLGFVALVAGPGVMHAQEPFIQTFPADIPPPEDFRANRTTYSAVMDVLAPTRTQVTDEQLEQLKKVSLESIFGEIGDYRANYARGFINTQPGQRIVGRAVTMRFLPPRPDLRQAADALAREGDWDRRYYARAAEEAKPYDVIVAELGGMDGHNFAGAMGGAGIQSRGAAGMVIDGGVRDLAGFQSEQFANFPSLVRFSDVNLTSWIGVGYNVPVRIGTATVLPGDVVVAEDGGVLFFPAELVPQILEAGAVHDDREVFQLELLNSKKYRFRDVYPLAPALEEEYQRTRQ